MKKNKVGLSYKRYIKFVKIFIALFLSFNQTIFMYSDDNDKEIQNLLESRMYRDINEIFPIPFFPKTSKEILGFPVSQISKDIVEVCLYIDEIMNVRQIEFIKSKGKLFYDGEWGTHFTDDFDADGLLETVYYGSYRDKNRQTGNFILVTKMRDKRTEIYLVKLFPSELGVFSPLYKQYKDKRIIFGYCGMIKRWGLVWDKGGPRFIDYCDD